MNSRPGFSLYPKHFFAALLLVSSASAFAADGVVDGKVTEGHPIGSAGFNDLLGKQVKPGTMSVEEQPDGSFLLTNKLQTVSAHITTANVQFDSIGNSAGKGGFGLQLAQWGRADNLQTATSSKLYRDGDIVYHTHLSSNQDMGIAEKFSNTTNGIQQDFIIAAKPEGSGNLHIQLQVSDAKVSAKNDGAIIHLNSGRELVYDHLHVTDSTNKTIASHIEVTNDSTMQVVVEDETAQYPLVIDPVVGNVNWVSMGGPPGTDGYVNAIVVDSSGNIYIGGSFVVVGSVVVHGIAKWNGVRWSAPGSGLWGVVNALALDNSGNVYASGSFTKTTDGSVTGLNNIAKWNGSSWTALGSGMSPSGGVVLAVDGSGNLYAGGSFTTAGGVAANNIAKWNGSSWAALGSGVSGSYRYYVGALAVDGSGNLYAGGVFDTAGGVAANNIAKWNGSSWTALGSGMSQSGAVKTLAVDGSGNLYAGGQFATGLSASYIVKWNGSSWTALGSGLNDVRALAVDGSGNLYADGYFTTAGNVAANNIAKWNGSSWTVYGSGMNGIILALAVDGSGNLYAGGSFTTAGGVAANYIAKWNGSTWGAPVTSLNYGITTGSVYALAVDSGGNVYAGGTFTTASGSNDIAKWDGSSWAALGSGMNGCVYALAMDGSGNLYAGGLFTKAGGVSAPYIAKWNGSSWAALGTALGSGVSDYVYALAMDGSGNLYAGGHFTTAGGVAAISIAKWNGSSWSALGSGITLDYGAEGIVNALAVDNSGNLYAGGYFSSAGGKGANNIAKWNGSSWAALGSGLGGSYHSVGALAVDDNGNVYAVTAVTAEDYIAKWNGSSWSALGSVEQGGGVGSTVSALAVDNGGNVYVGGSFTTADGVAANNIAKWNGSSWAALGSGTNDYINALALDSRHNLYAGGHFTVAGAKASAYMAKWLWVDTDNDGVEDVSDAFPTNAAASLSTGGYPSKWNEPLAQTLYGCASNAPTCNGLILASTIAPNGLGYGFDGLYSLNPDGSNIANSIASNGLRYIFDYTYSLDPNGSNIVGSIAANGLTYGFDDKYSLNPNGSNIAGTTAPNGLGYGYDDSHGLNPYFQLLRNDFGNDGKSDILFLNTTTGGTLYWKDATKSQAVYPGAYDTTYTYAGSGDFNGDGKADILFTKSSNNGTLVWNNAVKTAATYPGTSAAGFSVAAICDTDGDSKDDVVWYNSATGATQIWPGAVKANVTYPGKQSAGFDIVACADFDGDGKADIFWRNGTAGGDQIWPGAVKANVTYPGTLPDTSWSVIGAGDVNGDGISDVIWYQAVNPLNPSIGSIAVWRSGQKAQATYPGSNGNTLTPVAIGDYDGDGLADLLWVNSATNGIEIWSGVRKGQNYESYPGIFPAGFAVQK